MINNLWFYKTNFNKTRNLVNELMVYLELDNKTLKSHYKYWKDIEGVKPDENWVSDEVYYKDDYVSLNQKDDNEIPDKDTCTHNYGIVENTANCEHDGTIIYRCANCFYEYSESSKALGHSFKNGVCTRDGCNEKDPKYKSAQNEVKDDKIDDDKKETPTHTTHDYSIEVSRTPAACTENGKVVKKCSGCDLTTEETLTAKGHSYGEWITATPATESANGTKKRTCSVCGNEQTDVIPKIEPTNPNPVQPDPVETSQNPDTGNGASEV